MNSPMPMIMLMPVKLAKADMASVASETGRAIILTGRGGKKKRC